MSQKKYEDKSKTWKPPFLLYGILAVFALYLGILIAANYNVGETVYDFFPRLVAHIEKKPLSFDFKNIFTPPTKAAACIFATEFVVILFIIYDMTKNRNYMVGKEHGTASWGSIAAINRKFEDARKGYNRIYTDNLRIGMESRKLNNHALFIGGSGVGKTTKGLMPNIFCAESKSKYPGSMVFTDPKGELLLKTGAYMKYIGYDIKVMNLVPGKMQESDCINMFNYIRTEADIDRIINALIKSTNQREGASTQDPFWENAERMFLRSLFLIVWMDAELFGWEKNFDTVLWLKNLASIEEEEESNLDQIFENLAIKTRSREGGGENHPAYKDYKKVMNGAGDTKRSIVLCVNARLSRFEIPDIRRMLSGRDIDLAAIGTGKVGGRKDVKTALFLIIPDSDNTYNPIISVVYTLLFQELIYQADFNYNGELPIPVTLWMDEFANIALPDDFLTLLTSIRSRLINCCIFIQSLVQLKGLFKDKYEIIIDNCDVCVYLGGNSQSTFEYISKSLGNKTIYKKSHGETKGSHGSTSATEDVLGRNLMLPEEVRELDNDYCVVFVRGQKPVLDRKYDVFSSNEYKLSCELGRYNHGLQKKLDNEGTIVLASLDEVSNTYESLIKVNLDERLVTSPSWKELQQLVLRNEEIEEQEKKNTIDIEKEDLMTLLMSEKLALNAAQTQEVVTGIKNGLSDEQIKAFILFDDARKMKSARMMYEAVNARKGC